MPITLWPANAVSGAPSYSGRMLRQALGVLLGGATAARPLGGRSGVRPGTSGLVTATSTTWTVNPHAGALDLEAAAAAGPYFYSVDDTANTGTVTAADATNPRLDIVYATLNDPAEGDGSSTPTVVFGYLAGTPAPTPAAPATPARSMVLSQISVPKSGSGSPTTTDAAPFTSATGAPILVRTQAERDALTAYDGLQVYRLDLHQLEAYNGTNWGPPVARALSTKVTASVGSITGAADVAVVTSSAAVTGDGVKRFKITASFWCFNSSVANDGFDFKIKDQNTGATIATFRDQASSTAGLSAGGGSFVITDVPAIGTHVYQLTAIRTSGTGTGTVSASATAPAELIVEQVA